MTTTDFSDQFSTLLNSYGTIGQFGDQASHQEIVLDEYEKSVFLTRAQDIIVKSYFERSGNSQGLGADDSALRQADFSSLYTVAELPAENSVAASSVFHNGSLLFSLPVNETGNSCNVLIIVQEKLLQYTNSGALEKEYVVKPISAQEYDRQMSKAYNKPLKRQAWRLFLNTAVGFDVKSEIIPRVSTTGKTWKYKVRYIRRPKPIVLEVLTDGLTVDGVSAISECELNPILHMDILLKAVELAAASRGIKQAQQTRQE